MSAPTGATGERVLAAIIGHMVATGGIPPTYREIGRRAGIKSTSVVYYHLQRLIDGGFLSPDESRTRYTIRVAGATWTPPAYLGHLVAYAEGEVVA